MNGGFGLWGHGGLGSSDMMGLGSGAQGVQTVRTRCVWAVGHSGFGQR